MKKINKELDESIQEMLQQASKNLANVVANSSFEFWQRKDFRLYVDFDNISSVEQDRMFNELEVSVLGLFHLHFDNAIQNGNAEQKVVLTFLKKAVSESFLELFRDLGLDEKHIKEWERLIDLRFKEYRKDIKIALKESSTWEEFGRDDTLRDTWARIETITIDCLTHLRRGNVEEGDPLWKLLRKWLMTLDATLHPITSSSDSPQKKN